MISLLYKRILRKLDLSEDELRELRGRLIMKSICSGSFLRGDKMCPNTTPLAIKKGINKFQGAREVKRLLKKHGVTGIELWPFYVLFDIPSMISERFFEKALEEMRYVVDELIKKSDGQGNK